MLNSKRWHLQKFILREDQIHEGYESITVQIIDFSDKRSDVEGLQYEYKRNVLEPDEFDYINNNSQNDPRFYYDTDSDNNSITLIISDKIKENNSEEKRALPENISQEAITYNYSGQITPLSDRGEATDFRAEDTGKGILKVDAEGNWSFENTDE